MKKLIGLLLIVLMSFSLANAQTDTSDAKTKVETFVNVDLVSKYIWRGAMMENGPNIQPIAGVTYGNLTVGCISSVSLINPFYEADLFASYLFPWVTIMVIDYYVDYTGSANSQNYFDYSDTIMYHNFTADLIIGNIDKFPIVLTASTIIYGGLDLGTTGNQNYTTYIELNYIQDKYEIFCGALTGSSDFYLYDKNHFGVVNIGAKLKRELNVTETFKVPVAASFIFNPEMNKFYLAFSVSF